jgi:hypothetical protein
MLKDEEIMLSYLKKMNEIKPCPRIELLKLAKGNPDDLDRWLHWLIDLDGFVKDVWREEHLYYWKTPSGEDFHFILTRHPDMWRLKHYSRERMPPTSARHHPPPRPNETEPAKQIGIATGY